MNDKTVFVKLDLLPFLRGWIVPRCELVMELQPGVARELRVECERTATAAAGHEGAEQFVGALRTLAGLLDAADDNARDVKSGGGHAG